ncbi:regulator of ribonuclease activity B [Alteromonadaceae bacterium 2753L.S.0a.02]|nr:regulator of ribonuclease activity B [Alteromonadaceae bacterium 2753L.S.0a.02]
MNWPNDSDGDVFRSLKSQGFDFTQEVEIDFIIDFYHWPLNKKEKESLRSLLPEIALIDPDEEDRKNGIDLGYGLVKRKSILTYEYVVEIQDYLTRLIERDVGGACRCWGVFH